MKFISKSFINGFKHLSCSLRQHTLLAIFTIILISSAQATAAIDENENQRQLLQLIEYIGVDYSAAINDGSIIDQGEYLEMQDFANIIADKSLLLSTTSSDLVDLSQSLKQAVADKQTTQAIQNITSQLKNILLQNSPTLLLPKELMSLDQVQQLFQDNCAACHGVEGAGDGQLAAGLIPAPTDFNEYERAMNRSIMGLYEVISGGLEGTAMTAYQQLNSRERWSLAFYAGSLAFNDQSSASEKVVSLKDLINFSPNEMIRNNPAVSATAIEKLRAQPEIFFSSHEDPFMIAHQQLDAALSAYKNGDLRQAKQLAVSAYLDGFELVENSIDARDKPFRKRVEAKLLGLRLALSQENNLNNVDDTITEIHQMLEQANQLISGSDMSDGTLFSASFIILLREGLEALLIVIALLTILMKSDKKQAIRYVHYGWISALVAGFITWLIAQYLVAISGASREIMEGGAALIAAIVLFYMGFWMHSKSKSGEWQRYIQQNIDRSLSTGTVWGIAGLSFISVYREVFETVLFYQSLMTQTVESQGLVLVSGFVAALVVLAIIAWMMIKYSVKLPIGKFFSITTYLLLALSFILMGKAITALQEAALISIAPMSINFQVDWLGINSTWQGVIAQLLIVILSAGLMLKQSMKSRPTS